MVRWMHGILTEKVKPCIYVDANISLYHSRYAYLQERGRVFSFLFENQNFPNNYFEQIKPKYKQHIPNSFSLFESNQMGKSLFS